MPGCVFVLSLYFPAVHLQWRMSMLMVANIISNIVSNILAYGIANINSSNGWHGWRWIFLVEGLLTFVIGVVCLFSSIGKPEKAAFLSRDEKDVIAVVVESRKSSIGVVAEWVLFLSNPLNYVWAALYVFTTTTLYSTAIFSPSFIQSFHPTWTTPQVQGQVVPVFVVACATCLFFGWLADRLNHRSGFALLGYVITIVGYSILRLPHQMSPEVLQFALYLVAIGTYISLPMIWALTCLNLATPFQKALGTAFVIGIGNVGGFVSAWIFRSSEAPYYVNGMTTAMIITCVAAGLTIVAWAGIEWSNSRQPQVEEEGNDSLKSGAVPRWVS
jgi:MFS family permease